MHVTEMRRPAHSTGSSRLRYAPPGRTEHIALSELMERSSREGLESKQLDMLRRGETTTAKDIMVHYVGDLDILALPAVSIVGTREVSERGRERATWLATQLATASVAV